MYCGFRCLAKFLAVGVDTGHRQGLGLLRQQLPREHKMPTQTPVSKPRESGCSDRNAVIITLGGTK